MLRTLFYIPHELAGWPLLGWGWALVIWLIVAGWILVRTWKQGGWSPETSSQLTMMVIVSVVLIWVLPRVEEPIPPGAWTLPPSAATSGVPIRGYGVMLLLGVVSGVGLAAWRAHRAGLDVEAIMGLAFSMVIGGIVGARLLFVFQYWHRLRGPTWRETMGNLLSVDKGGLVVYGSLIGAGVAFLYFTWKHRLPALALADLIAPSLALGLALGRVGCLMNGCCFGGPCDLPWAVTFPESSPPYEEQKEVGLFHGLRVAANARGEPEIAWIDPSGPLASAMQHGMVKIGDTIVAVNGHPTPVLPVLLEVFRLSGPSVTITLSNGRQLTAAAASLPARSQPIHPAQLYSAINGLILCVFALAFYPCRNRHGQVIAMLLSLYAFTRFMEERIRVDEQAWVASLTISEAISVGLGLAMILLWIYIARQPRIDAAGGRVQVEGG